MFTTVDHIFPRPQYAIRDRMLSVGLPEDIATDTIDRLFLLGVRTLADYAMITEDFLDAHMIPPVFCF
jgi:hypothetical protein